MKNENDFSSPFPFHPMSLVNLSTPEIWFVCGSQHLYGPGPLKQVAATAQAVVDGLVASKRLAPPLKFKALLTTPEEISKVCIEANTDANCAGLVLWMHTFSPSKMWIRGLTTLKVAEFQWHGHRGRLFST